MKKYVLAILIMAMATPALAGFSIKNLDIFGSHDNKKHRNKASVERPEPNPPVHNVPEPGTLILLSLGAAALVVGGAVEKGNRHD